jgi:hypothetical protein
MCCDVIGYDLKIVSTEAELLGNEELIDGGKSGVKLKAVLVRPSAKKTRSNRITE